MARKKFVLMAENKEVVFEALHSPYVAMSSNPNSIEQHPATRYFVAVWLNKDELGKSPNADDFHPTIIDELGGNREYAEAVVCEWNRLERETWIPEDSCNQPRQNGVSAPKTR